MDSCARRRASPPPLPRPPARPQPATERRSEPRASCDVAVVVEMDGRATRAVARDLSVGGAFIECPRLHTEGRQLRLRFPVVGLPPAIHAEVRWVLRGPDGGTLGAGVRLDVMGAREMIRWTRYVRSLREGSAVPARTPPSPGSPASV